MLANFTPLSKNRVERNCPNCGKVFYIWPSMVRYGRGTYCSRVCYTANGPGKKSLPLAEKFWAKVRATDACWIWEGPKNELGYGYIPTSFKNKVTHYKAHRIAWEIIIGPIPDGLEVCHDCPGGDNPSCVNPAHMFLGTHAENMADMARKGHSNRGERSPMAKLTENDVREIRRIYATGGIMQKEIAVQFGVCNATIHDVVHGIKWHHVT